MDLLQQRKCIDFKRMMLEACPRGAGIGINIPIGYDEVTDIESWPLLQAFALEEVFTSTGFFTAFYSVVDITEYTDVLYRTVDAGVVNHAIDVMVQSILPHSLQFIKMCDAETADQRAAITAEDCIGPLSMLFEFGELEAATPVDPQLKPTLLYGAASEYLGDASYARRPELLKAPAGDNAHLVVEGCEPATGIRYQFLNICK
jgi:hypothetical protein